MPARKQAIKKEEVEESRPEVRLETKVEESTGVGPESINKMMQAAAGAAQGTATDTTAPSVSGLEISPPSAPVSTPTVEVVPIVEEKKAGTGMWLSVGIAFVVGMALGALGGYGVWGGGIWEKLMAKKSAVVGQTSRNKATISPTLEPTATPMLSRKDLKIRVLNGSGVKGAAAGASDYLQSLGYVVESVGNAVRDDYSEMAVDLGIGKEGYWAMLKTDLGVKYNVASEAGKLGEAAEYDAVVTVGVQ